MIVHATHSEASRRISPKMLFALLLLAPRALLLTLHVYCKPSGGRASRFFFLSSRADERSQPPSLRPVVVIAILRHEAEVIGDFAAS